MSPAMTAVCEIRPVLPGEALAVARMHVRADRATYRPIFGARFKGVAVAQSKARWEAALVADDILLAAVEGGRIVGFAHAAGAWMSLGNFIMYRLVNFKV